MITKHTRWLIAVAVLLVGNAVVSGAMLYRQTQMQRAMMQLGRNSADLKLESQARRQEYWDIMTALDVQKRTGEILIQSRDADADAGDLDKTLPGSTAQD